jgi:hypothetical protein
LAWFCSTRVKREPRDVIGWLSIVWYYVGPQALSTLILRLGYDPGYVSPVAFSGLPPLVSLLFDIFAYLNVYCVNVFCTILCQNNCLKCDYKHSIILNEI